jgi:multidrug efflux pump subunit AcrA (membrane-fusion protein)
MAGLEPGMTARIKLDAYDYQKYGTLTGKITSISPDSQMKEQQVFYVVKIAIEGREVGHDRLRGPIKFGMTGQVEIVTGNETMFSVLMKKIQRSVSLS